MPCAGRRGVPQLRPRPVINRCTSGNLSVKHTALTGLPVSAPCGVSILRRTSPSDIRVAKSFPSAVRSSPPSTSVTVERRQVKRIAPDPRGHRRSLFPAAIHPAGPFCREEHLSDNCPTNLWRTALAPAPPRKSAPIPGGADHVQLFRSAQIGQSIKEEDSMKVPFVDLKSQYETIRSGGGVGDPGGAGPDGLCRAGLSSPGSRRSSPSFAAPGTQ